MTTPPESDVLAQDLAMDQPRRNPTEADSNNICPHPIFIIGAPRSGTSALAWSLAQHSQLWTSEESLIVSFLLHDGLKRTFENARDVPRNWLQVQQVDWSEFLRWSGLGLNALFTSRSGGKRWIDQTPQYTLYADEIGQMVPGACFIHIVRDGRRVVNSMINFGNSLPAEFQAIQDEIGIGRWRDFRVACGIWRRYVEAALDFSAKHADRCLTVVNEELVTNPERGFRSILEFIGETYEDAPAEFFKSHRVNSSFAQSPVQSNGSYQLAEPWKTWTPEQHQVFWAEAGPTFIRAGFPGPDESMEATLSLAQRHEQLQKDYAELKNKYQELEGWAHEMEATLKAQSLQSGRLSALARLLKRG